MSKKDISRSVLIALLSIILILIGCSENNEIKIITEAEKYETADSWAKTIECIEPIFSIWNKDTNKGMLLPIQVNESGETVISYTVKEGDELIICFPKNANVVVGAVGYIEEIRTTDSYNECKIVNDENLKEFSFPYYIKVDDKQYNYVFKFTTD